MATAPKQAIASPQIFSTDPIEQVYGGALAKSDPSTSGFLGSLLLAAGTERDRNQSTYLDNLASSNRLSALLSQQGEQAETAREAMKQVPHYANAGLQIADFPLVGRTATDPNAASVRLPATLHNAEIQAKINKLNAEATAKFGENAPKIKSEYAVDSNGVGQTQLTITGGDPRLHPALREWWLKSDAESRNSGASVRPGQAQGRQTSQGAVIQRHPGAN